MNCKNLRSNWIRCCVPHSSKDRHPRIVADGSRLGPRITRRDLKKVSEFFKELEHLNAVEFPRCLTPLSAIGTPVLCVFADASRKAFGACAYVRWQIENGKFESRFIAAKSRVAPLKELTIPRQELQSAVLASRLAKSILEESRLEFKKIIYFTDSQIVLAWIRSHA